MVPPTAGRAVLHQLRLSWTIPQRRSHRKSDLGTSSIEGAELTFQLSRTTGVELTVKATKDNGVGFCWGRGKGQGARDSEQSSASEEESTAPINPRRQLVTQGAWNSDSSGKHSHQEEGWTQDAQQRVDPGKTGYWKVQVDITCQILEWQEWRGH